MRVRAVVLSILVVAFSCDNMALSLADGAASAARPQGFLPAAAIQALEALTASQRQRAATSPATSPVAPAAAHSPPPPDLPPNVCGPPLAGAPLALVELAMARLLLRASSGAGGWNGLLTPSRPLDGQARAPRRGPAVAPSIGIVTEPVDPPG